MTYLLPSLMVYLLYDPQDEEGEDKGDDAHERFQGYCSRMLEAAAWGSQLELGALAQCLRQRIDIYSVGLPTVLMGEEFEGALHQGNTPSVVRPSHGSYSIENGNTGGYLRMYICYVKLATCIIILFHPDCGHACLALEHLMLLVDESDVSRFTCQKKFS